MTSQAEIDAALGERRGPFTGYWCETCRYGRPRDRDDTEGWGLECPVCHRSMLRVVIFQERRRPGPTVKPYAGPDRRCAT